MRIKKGFNLREICGEQIVVAEGSENVDFSKIISVNESAALLWKNVSGTEFTMDTLAEILVDNYNVDYDTALTDAREIARKWVEAGMVEE